MYQFRPPQPPKLLLSVSKPKVPGIVISTPISSLRNKARLPRKEKKAFLLGMRLYRYGKNREECFYGKRMINGGKIPYKFMYA